MREDFEGALRRTLHDAGLLKTDGEKRIEARWREEENRIISQALTIVLIIVVVVMVIAGIFLSIRRADTDPISNWGSGVYLSTLRCRNVPNGISKCADRFPLL